MSRTATRSHAIELVKIIACLLVIMAHIQVVINDGNSIVTGRLFFSTIIADDVPLFLLVTGFFFFHRIHSDSDIVPAFPHKAKTFLSRIYIPTIAYIIINILYRYFTGPQGSILTADWNYLGRFVFRLAPGDHLWYICTYMSFVIALIFRFTVEKPVAWIFDRKKKSGIHAGPSGAIPPSNPSA